ncbi:MAG: MarR family transcriptional regulator [Nitrospiraceae bacterium]|nr:MAG: MarR family transcriptional regulator [Nitrospiraceae bacterium]
MSDTEGYEEKILLNVRKIMRAIDMYSSHLARQFGLTSPQLICLKKLVETGDITPGSLAKSVHLSHATVTGIINRLEKKGLVARNRSLEDGRSFLIRITSQGRAMIQSSPSMLQEQFMRELSRLSDWEKTMILSSLQRITAMLSVDSIEVAPVLTTGPVEAPAEKIRDLLDPDDREA